MGANITAVRMTGKGSYGYRSTYGYPYGWLAGNVPTR